MPHSRSTGWESKANSYIPYQSPCWWGNHLSKGILNGSETLLGIVGDLFEVSLALEENIVPEYLTSRNLEIVHLSLIENIYFGTYYSVRSI